MIALAISFAAVAAVFLALAARLQHRGVRASGPSERVGLGTIAAMLRNRQWLSGSAMLGAGTGLHLVALALAPLAVVQPIGALAPALTTVLNARATGRRPSRSAIAGALAVAGGIGIFVVVSAQQPVGGTTVRYAESIAIGLIGLLVAVAATIAWRTNGRIRCCPARSAAAWLLAWSRHLYGPALRNSSPRNGFRCCWGPLSGSGWPSRSVRIWSSRHIPVVRPMW
ncbi:hypothetical protein [Fodinicola feengrottensis]|uniref:hypothetical protein n=1 Tax=Fodinicola feengrottensis TaxID=435914 RepID=UPI0013D00766|nr:hypothetical protein [Fodinicola feengrottensis]